VNRMVLEPDSPMYPADMRRGLNPALSPALTLAGNADLLRLRSLGFLSSIQYPGEVILKTYDLVSALRELGIPVIGGFHSPMEKECLAWLLRGCQPLLIFLGRSLEGFRLPLAWRRPLADGRLLVLSCFDARRQRLTASTATLRNRAVAALADQVLIAYASCGGHTEALCRSLVAAQKVVWTPACDANERLVALGAKPLVPNSLDALQAALQGP
jgi:predicted Rossmann fold nucleotide-binding protein DprA/Smf involved in DNA uptake